MNKRTIFIATAGLLVIVAVGFYVLMGTNEKNANDIAPTAGAPAQAVSVITIENQPITMSKTLPGRISAFRQSQVRPQVNGIIMERLFEEGAVVEKGQQLYQIDDARFNAALASANADLKSAQSSIASVDAKTRRFAKLVKIDAVSRQEYDDVKAQLDQANAAVAVAKAAVDVAQVNLDYTKVYAPIAGRIGRSLVTEGALVTANQEQPMAVITQMDPVYVDMQQAGGDALALQQAHMGGQGDIPVTIMLGESNQIAYPHTGSLKFSEVTIDETTGSIALRATMPNPDGALMTGLFVHGSLDMGQTQGILVPQRATTRNPDGNMNVWVVDENNIATPRPIQTNGAHQDNWIVTDGLKAGDTIIIEGYQKIASGADVTTSPWVKNSEAVSKTQSKSLEQE